MEEPAPKRFLADTGTDCCEDDLDEDLGSDFNLPAISVRSRKVNSGWLSVVSAYNKLQESPLLIDDCTKDQLDSFLCKLYPGVKRQDGSAYQAASLRCLRSALRRYIEEERNWNIVRDPAFESANDCFHGVLEKLEPRPDHPPVQHRDLTVISDADMQRMTDTFLQCHGPALLVMEVWFYLTYHFSLSGRRTQRQVKKSDLALKVDRTGHEYFLFNVGETERNQSGTATYRHDTTPAGRIKDRYQVSRIKTLLAHLHPEQEALFQKPRRTLREGDDVWFKNIPIGTHGLAQIMPRLSTLCGLSKSYTDYSVLATRGHHLWQAGVRDHHANKEKGRSDYPSLSSDNMLWSPSDRRTSVPDKTSTRQSQQPASFGSCMPAPRPSPQPILSSPAISSQPLQRVQCISRTSVPPPATHPTQQPPQQAYFRPPRPTEIRLSFASDVPPPSPSPAPRPFVLPSPSRLQAAAPRASLHNSHSRTASWSGEHSLDQDQQQVVHCALRPLLFGGKMQACKITINMQPY
ncbi:uncharacterized protein LOC135816509 [Sycon ciliatum]|uniref:uncharacterized protein LOC135816509 n=1 Tax=Sycon ciliatum TaxID=27933 RepID=UPI0031F6C623